MSAKEANHFPALKTNLVNRLGFICVFLLLTACSSPTPDPTANDSQVPASTSEVQPPPLDIVSVQTVTLSNLALDQPVIASATQSNNPPELAVDGINSPDNFWSAGGEPPHWIEIDLGKPSDIYEIQLVVFQHPEGNSFHRVLGRAENDDEYQELHVFSEFTQDGQVLSFEPAEPWTNLRFLRIETLESAPTAYVEWREIIVMGVTSGADVLQINPSDPEIIFFNGQLITMEADQPFAEAIAINDQMILAVGSDVEILSLAGPGTQVIDLEGYTLMPGIVDAHTHLLTASGVSIEDAQIMALENGITTLGELNILYDTLPDFEALDAEGRLRVRVSLYLSYTSACGALRDDWYLEHPQTREFGEMLRIGGVKLFADGGTCGLPAVSFEYPGGQGNGDLWFTQEEMVAQVAQAHSQGYQIAIHAQGDAAVEQALNAIEIVLAGQENTPRHRIEHNAFVREDQLPRYSQIGVVPTIFGTYPTCSEVNEQAYSNFFGMENVLWLEDWRSFLDANPDLPIAWHGDDPWLVPVSPWVELYSLVTRKQVDEDGSICEPPDWLAEHTITTEEGLRLMTTGAAYSLFREEEVGSLAPGKFADLLILSLGPLDDPDAIKDIEVWMTMVGGRTEYCAAPDAQLCPIN